MSKKHKHKHKHHHSNPHHAEVQSTEVGFPAPHEVAVVPAPPEASSGYNWGRLLPFLVFLLGIFLGAIGTLLVTTSTSPKAWLEKFSRHDIGELEIIQREMHQKDFTSKEGRGVALPPFIYAPSAPASATSSMFSIRVPTIVYHSVRPYREGESSYQDAYDITPELLDQQLSYMESHGYHAVLPRDLHAFWRGAIPSLPENPVILSFDDGWQNQYAYALPVLEKHKMKAVFYIFNNPIDHKKPQWMSWEEIIALDKAGMEIGGHSFTHPVLTTITSEGRLDHEIADAKKIIEEHLGHSILSFAYPFGANNETVEIAVARAGYQMARTVVSGVWNDPEHRLNFHGTLASDRMSQFESLLSRE